MCRDPECQFFNRRVWLEVVASIPPVPINGAEDFWHEYEGGDMEFYLGLCRYCRTAILDRPGTIWHYRGLRWLQGYCRGAGPRGRVVAATVAGIPNKADTLMP